MSHAKQMNCISYDIFLHFKIKRGIRCETWSMVNLNQPRFKLFINQHIKAENFKTHGIYISTIVFVICASVLSFVWHSQIMLQTWLDRAHGFDDQLLYLMHHFIALSLTVVIFFFDIIQNGSKRTLMAGVSIIQSLVKNKFTFISAIDKSLLRQIRQDLSAIGHPSA